MPNVTQSLLILLVWMALMTHGQADQPAQDFVAPPLPSEHDRERLCISRIYHGSDFELQQTAMRWDESQDVLWWQRDNSEGKTEIVRVTVPDMAETVAVAADQFQLPSGERIVVEDYQWSLDQKFLLVKTNSVRVWRNNTRADYWLLDRLSKTWRRLGGQDASSQSLMFPTFSPSGGFIAYVRERGLYLESTTTGEIQTIAADENPKWIHGTFDWVYEEELDLAQGFQFSPTGEKVAFWQLDETGVPVHTLIDNTSQRYPAIKQYAYPKVGQTNAAARIGVWDLNTGQTVWMQVEGDPRQNYLAALQWLPPRTSSTKDRLLIQQLNRRQNENRLWLCDAATGASVVVLRETGPGWVRHQAELPVLPPNENETSQRAAETQDLGDAGRVDLVWLSERSGWQHVYRLSIPAHMPNEADDQRQPHQKTPDETQTHPDVSLEPITAGPWDVIELDKVDPQSGHVFFTASPDNAATRGLYRCPTHLASPIEDVTRVSPPEDGTFQYAISDSATYAIETWSAFNTPPVKRLVALDPYRRIETLIDNAKARNAIDELLPIEQEFVSLSINDDVSLDAWIMMPPSEAVDDAASGAEHSLPLILHVYGEPAGQTVRDVYGGSGYLWHRYLVQLGFAVASIDNRGVAAPRGRDFRQSVYGKIGILPPADQAAGVRQLLKRYPQIDPARIGVWGWSGGGSTTLHSIFRYPDLYASAIAVAAVPDQLDYDTIYQERYMGLVEDDRQRFEQGSPITHAEGLADPLLIIHGTGDDNVHYASTERLINRLVAHGKKFRLMAYPGRSHSISEGEGTTMHLRQMMVDFFLETLMPGQ